MNRAFRAVLPLVLACTGRPTAEGTVNATLDGNVFVTGPVAGVSNAMPPTRMDSIDWVCTVRPLAESETSSPLAFQKRVFAVTY